MSDADDHLRVGNIDQARASLVDTVRKSPQDQSARMFLFQLLAVCGEWDKAAAQLRALAQLSPEAQMLATVYSQAIEAEKVRAAAFAGQAPFNLIVATSPWVEQAALAMTAAALGRPEEAAQLREAAFSEAPDTPGEIDGQAFTWIADADGRFGPMIEAIVWGKWGLIPFKAIAQIKSEGPKDLRDTVWLPCEMMLRSGQSAAVLLPARYPGSEASTDAQVRLGRATEWSQATGGDAGLGQRLWTLSDGEDIDILSLRKLVMV